MRSHFLRAATVKELVTDPYFSSVSLLLHGNGSNGSTTITDSSPSPKTVTANGSAAISTTQSKPGFGGASLSIPGVGNYFSVQSGSTIALGTADFTVEMWLYRTARAATGGNSDCIFSIGNPGISLFIDPGGQINLSNFGVAVIAVTSTTITNGQWTHIAVARSGSTTKIFIDGIQGASVSDGSNYSQTTSLNIGRDAFSPALQFLNGFIDEFRITKGVARYAANFTPPTAPFPDA